MFDFLLALVFLASAGALIALAAGEAVVVLIDDMLSD